MQSQYLSYHLHYSNRGVARGFQMQVYWFGQPNYVAKLKENQCKTTSAILSKSCSKMHSDTFKSYLMYACVCCSSLFKCITMYCFYKQIEPFQCLQTKPCIWHCQITLFPFVLSQISFGYTS